MGKNYVKKFVAVASMQAILLASPAYAFTINNATDINNKILCPIFSWMFLFLITISAIMGLVGGFLYLTSGGDSEKVSKAHKTLIYTVIGIAVALMAKGFPSLVSSLFGSGTITVC